MRRLVIPCSAALLLTFSACITSPEDYPYEYRSEQWEKTLSADIDQIFYHGFRKHYNQILLPYEYSEDGFYLLNSPEMLDSIFMEVNYPGIDTLFPEDGVLLLFTTSVFFGHELTDNVIFFNDSILNVHLRFREWEGLFDPGVWEFVFPVGITFK